MSTDIKYKLAFFDLDGTILDTIEGLARSMNETRVSNGLEPQPLPLVQSMVGNGIRKLIARSTASDEGADQEKLFTEFMSYYNAHCVELTTPYDGVKELLQYIREKGMKTSVSTNKPDEPAKELINALLPDLFDHVQGQIDGIPLKPDPASVLEVCKKFNVEPSECVYIGDSEVDIAMAANSGMDSISVDWGFKTHEFLVEHGASLIVSSMDELKEALCVSN